MNSVPTKYPSNLSLIRISFFGIWLVCFFGATDFAGLRDFSALLYYPKDILNRGAGEGLTMKRIIYFVCMVVVLFQNKNLFVRKGNKEIFFWNLNLFVIFLTFLNPNNTFKSLFGILICHESIIYLLYLMTLYYILFLDKRVLLIQAKEIVKSGVIISTVMCFVGLFNYFFGPVATTFFDRHVTIQISDILLLLSTFQALILIILLNTRKKILLIIWLLHIVVIFLSLRRTFFFATLVGDIMCILFMPYPQKKGLLIKLLLAISIFLSIGVSDSLLRKQSFFLERFFTIFSSQEFHDDSDKHKGSSGHWEQSLTSTEYLFNKSIDSFFGVGINSNDKIKIPGSYEGYIHNTYVYSWAKYGLNMLIFMVLLTLYFLFKSYPLWLLLKTKTYHFLSFLIFFYLAIGWATPVVTYLLMDISYFIQFLLLLMLYRLKGAVDYIIHERV
jgi:hypothetical protein